MIRISEDGLTGAGRGERWEGGRERRSPGILNGLAVFLCSACAGFPPFVDVFFYLSSSEGGFSSLTRRERERKYTLSHFILPTSAFSLHSPVSSVHPSSSSSSYPPPRNSPHDVLGRIQTRTSGPAGL
jgi:heme/copper-type cytochrome/quinol oxidase subunit 3